MPAGALSRLLLAVHNAVSAVPAERCREALLEVLRGAIPFDAAIWGSGAESPQLVFGIASLDFPIDRLMAYAAWQPQDALRAALARQPGTALRNEDIGSLDDHYASAIYREFCGPCGIEHALGISELDSQTMVGELVFLFRGRREAPFSDAERDLLEQCLPHMLAAARGREVQALVRQLAPQGEIHGSGHAIIDDVGHVHSSDAAFGLAMRQAFPDWLGPRLPPALLPRAPGVNGLRRAGGQTFELLRGRERHLLRLRAQGKNPLSPAERRVAHLFASGLTARKVAEALGLSPLTVRNHLTAIYTRLGVNNKAALVRAVQQLGD